MTAQILDFRTYIAKQRSESTREERIWTTQAKIWKIICEQPKTIEQKCAIMRGVQEDRERKHGIKI